MQDRKNNPIDDRFVDQAWLDMRRLLDREMPVRPMLPWWQRSAALLLLLLGGTLGFGLATWYWGGTVSPDRLPTDRVAFSLQEQPSADPWLERCPENWLAGKDDLAQKEEYPHPALAEIPVELPELAAHQPSTGPEQHSSEPLLQVDPDCSLPLAIRIQTQPISPLAPLPPCPLAPSTTFSTSVSSVPSVPSAPSVSSSFLFYTRAGAYLSGGYSGGLGLSYPLHKRLQFEVGLNYNRIVPTEGRALLTAQADDNLDAPPVVVNTGNDTVEVYTAESTDTSLAIALRSESMHYLGLPVALSIGLDSWLDLRIGLTPQFLLASYPVPGGWLSGDEASKYAADFNLLAQNSDPEPFPGDVRAFDLSYSLGLTFRPWKRLGVSLAYEQGLLDLQPNLSGRQIRRQLGLEVTYYLPAGR